VIGFIDIVVVIDQVRVIDSRSLRLLSYPEERRRPAAEKSLNSKIGAKI
jgi:hypothetical protein